MAVETTLIDLGIQILINVIVLSPVLWISGRLLAGKDKAKFTDALWIVVLGTLIGIGFNYFFAESLGAVTGIIASIIMLIIWLGLVKHLSSDNPYSNNRAAGDYRNRHWAHRVLA
jgi:hypothetical protein